jgi:hypothetical protein
MPRGLDLRYLMNRSNRPSSLAFLGTSLVLALCVCGCGMPSIKDTTKAATAGVLDQSVEALEDARARQRIETIVSSPEMQRAMRDIAGGFTDGVTGSLTGEDSTRRIALLTQVIATAAARGAIESVLGEMTSAKNQTRMGEMAASTATAGTRAVMEEMTRQLAIMTMTLGPALRTTLRDDVAPGLRDAVGNPEITTALAATAFEVSRQVVLGTNQGMADLEARHRKEGTLAKLTALLANFSWLLPFLLGLGLATVVVVLVMWRRARSGHDQQIEQRPDAERSASYRYLAQRRRRFSRRATA